MRRRVAKGVGIGMLCSLAMVVTAAGTFLLASLLNPVPVAAAEEAGTSANGGQPLRDKSLLMWTYESLGPEYTIAFLAMSFSAVALIVMNILTARRDNFCPSHLVADFEAHLNEKHYQEAYELAKSDESVLGRILSEGMANLQHGYPKALEAMQTAGEDENMKLEHRMSYLGLIGAVAPMVGLLGTVHGMIMAFEVIASRNTTPKPSELAKGVSTALFTTIVGLLIAIPVVAIFTYFKNRFARMMFEVGTCVSQLMDRFEKAGPTQP